ncbi:MAG: hypothetical protein M3Z35_01595, partial [Nitrospirota bacterium]|nr:hypothetical protein [Nitrospirota bacterium]
MNRFALTTIPVLMLLASCSQTVLSHRPASPDFGTIAFLAEDYRFDGPQKVMAGDTIIRMRNQGREAHHIQLVRLDTGHTLAELVETLRGPVTQIPA